MTRQEWAVMFRGIRSKNETTTVEYQGRKYYVGKSGVKALRGRAVLFSMVEHSRFLGRRMLRKAALISARNYRLELETWTKREVDVFGKASQPGVQFVNKR